MPNREGSRNSVPREDKAGENAPLGPPREILAGRNASSDPDNRKT